MKGSQRQGGGEGGRRRNNKEADVGKRLDEGETRGKRLSRKL